MSTYSVNQNVLSVYPGGFRARQESHDRRNLINSSDALQRVSVGDGRDELFRFAVSEKWSVDGAWRDSISGDTPGAEFFGQDARESLDCAFCRGVDEVGRDDYCYESANLKKMILPTSEAVSLTKVQTRA